MPLDLSFDPLNVPASSGHLKIAMERILELPVSTTSGLVYQFSDFDERKMRKAQRGLLAGGVVNWRQLNNDETPLNAQSMLDLINELDSRQFQRGIVVDAEYMAFKLSSSYTKRQLADWERKYDNGFIPVSV
ncbi:MAG: hypothetical protein ACRBBW_20840 [Cellvibrionaceae bacterium]